MSNGHSVIPLDGSELATASIGWLRGEGEMVFVPDSLPQGRFPTLAELRQVIHNLGYELEETHDWYVTSDNDFTEIWFKGETRSESSPTEFWFRRGDAIVLDIMQQIANQCGSFIVVDHSGAVQIVIVADSVFSAAQLKEQSSFIDTMSNRIPLMFEQLQKSSLENTLFLLSQIRQPLIIFDYMRNYELFRIAQTGLPTYAELLKHNDERVRFMAFDLAAMFREQFYFYAETLGQAIKGETDSDTRARMIWSTEQRILGRPSYGEIDQRIQAILDMLLELSNDDSVALPVRYAASNTLVRAKPGFLTSAIRSTFTEALIQPEQYTAAWDFHGSVSRETLKSIEKLLFRHRLEILGAALPQITFAQDAHTVLRELLDNVFFGKVQNLSMTSLPDDYIAERPEVDETKFREHRSRGWLYLTKPTQLRADELLPFQREVLEAAIDLEIPWMVHSNLLEKYGLPPTRKALRDFLALK